MAKTFLNGITSTRTLLDEVSQADWLDTEVKSEWNLAYQDVAGKVIEVNEEWYEVTTPYTYAIVADQQEYTISSSLIKVSRVEINYNPQTSGSVAVRALPIRKDEIRNNLANTNLISRSESSPGYYVHGSIGAQKIGFVPIPTEADTTGQSISVWGPALPADLSANGDNVNIPWADRFIYLINLRAAASLLRKGQQEESSAQRYIQEYDKGVIEMQNFLKDRQGDDGAYIIDALQEDIDFTI